MSNDSKKLLAEFEPVDAMAPIDTTWVNRKLADEGYATLFVLPDVLDQVVKKYNSATGFTLTIAERRDGVFSLHIDEDLMAAQLTMTPAYGGTGVSSDQIYAALQEKNIVFGIHKEIIESSVAKGYARNKLVAEGVHPAPGVDGKLISLIRETNNIRLASDDEATIDYRSFGNIISVKPGDPLMRRLPPSEGAPGTNIFGAAVPPVIGVDVQFSTFLQGSVLSADDPDLLVAAISGQPVLMPNGVNVEPVITIKNVDLSTGNLDIEGTLNITGDVTSGMQVKATGNVVIQGFVEAACIDSGGDVEIKGGIIGQGEVRNSEGMLSPGAAIIMAKGSVKAHFVENAFVSAGADVLVQDFVLNSEVNAGNRLAVGEPGSCRGRIISAICRARARVDATSIGSRAGVSTMIEIGADPVAREKLTAIQQILKNKAKELEETTKALEYFHDNPSRNVAGAARDKENALSRLQTEIQELAGQKKRLQKRIEPPADARITVEREVYSGVCIRIGEKTLVLLEDVQNVTFRIGDEGITY
jgi:uncharacterized protein (DUF342 family)